MSYKPLILKEDETGTICTDCTATPTDGTLAKERSHELLDTELAREVLEAIVGGCYAK